MKKRQFLLRTLILIFTFLAFPQAGTTPGMAQAQTKPTVASFQCTISSIATVQFVEATNIPEEDRIHVSCATPPEGSISFFASAVWYQCGERQPVPNGAEYRGGPGKNRNRLL